MGSTCGRACMNAPALRIPFRAVHGWADRGLPGLLGRRGTAGRPGTPPGGRWSAVLSPHPLRPRPPPPPSRREHTAVLCPWVWGRGMVGGLGAAGRRAPAGCPDSGRFPCRARFGGRRPWQSVPRHCAEWPPVFWPGGRAMQCPGQTTESIQNTGVPCAQDIIWFKSGGTIYRKHPVVCFLFWDFLVRVHTLAGYLCLSTHRHRLFRALSQCQEVPGSSICVRPIPCMYCAGCSPRLHSVLKLLLTLCPPQRHLQQRWRAKSQHTRQPNWFCSTGRNSDKTTRPFCLVKLWVKKTTH